MKLTILTLSPDASLFRRTLMASKNTIRNLFFFYGGPQSVLDSLKKGLVSLGIEYRFNPKSNNVVENVGVLSNVKALRWAIEAKKNGRIKKLITGPNLVILPTDDGSIMLDEAIDLVLIPSTWVKNFWLSITPQLKDKLKVWATGVEIQPQKNISRKGCLIYKKKISEKLFKDVLDELKLRNISYQVLQYGKYKKQDYFDTLAKVEFMICLSESESQGLALIEAWMKDVPTLIWNRGYWEGHGYKWKDEKISAPYLTQECGMFFKDDNDFKQKLSNFSGKITQFNPRQYVIKNFTDEITTRNYLKNFNL